MSATAAAAGEGQTGEHQSQRIKGEFHVVSPGSQWVFFARLLAFTLR